MHTRTWAGPSYDEWAAFKIRYPWIDTLLEKIQSHMMSALHDDLPMAANTTTATATASASAPACAFASSNNTYECVSVSTNLM